MKNIKRTVRTHGRVLGHQKGVNSPEILDYVAAKHQIYIPAFKWVLENKVANIIDRLKIASIDKTVVLLDYNTCCDVDSVSKPLSHAYLIKAYAEGLYPYGPKQVIDNSNPSLPFDD